MCKWGMRNFSQQEDVRHGYVDSHEARKRANHVKAISASILCMIMFT